MSVGIQWCVIQHTDRCWYWGCVTQCSTRYWYSMICNPVYYQISVHDDVLPDVGTWWCVTQMLVHSVPSVLWGPYSCLHGLALAFRCTWPLPVKTPNCIVPPHSQNRMEARETLSLFYWLSSLSVWVGIWGHGGEGESQSLPGTCDGTKFSS